jgi:hypothetical protein
MHGYERVEKAGLSRPAFFLLCLLSITTPRPSEPLNYERCPYPEARLDVFRIGTGILMPKDDACSLCRHAAPPFYSPPEAYLGSGLSHNPAVRALQGTP